MQDSHSNMHYSFDPVLVYVTLIDGGVINIVRWHTGLIITNSPGECRPLDTHLTSRRRRRLEEVNRDTKYMTLEKSCNNIFIRIVANTLVKVWIKFNKKK